MLVVVTVLLQLALQSKPLNTINISRAKEKHKE
jgi:hypothetical protein